MREILFRGKRKDTGEWFYGDLLHEPSGFVIQSYFPLSGRIRVEVDPSTVCQYTGVLDKANKRIFSGDIVKIYVKYEEIERFCIFEYYECTTAFEFVDHEHDELVDKTLLLEHKLTIEIIGNIYDNPELLKEITS